MKKLFEFKKALRAAADSKRAVSSLRFFKTEPGDYGAGDNFLGVSVVDNRRILRDFRDLSLNDCAELLDSPWHEERLSALFIMVDRFKRGDDCVRTAIKKLYELKMDRVNNWDLVDSSAHYIYGEWFRLNGCDPLPVLRRLAKSKNLWRRRIAVMSTFIYIKNGSFKEALDIVDLLLHDPHDLIQKVVGWMLREIGNRDRTTEENFLLSRYKTMPRTALRYAIEKFSEARRRAYLTNTINKNPAG